MIEIVANVIGTLLCGSIFGFLIGYKAGRASRNESR